MRHLVTRFTHKMATFISATRHVLSFQKWVLQEISSENDSIKQDTTSTCTWYSGQFENTSTQRLPPQINYQNYWSTVHRHVLISRYAHEIVNIHDASIICYIIVGNCNDQKILWESFCLWQEAYPGCNSKCFCWQIFQYQLYLIQTWLKVTVLLTCQF